MQQAPNTSGVSGDRGDHSSAYAVVPVPNPALRANEILAGYENLLHPRCREIRERYGVDDVVADESDEFRRILLLRHWIRAHMSINDTDPTPTRGDAFGILDAALNGGGFHCAHFMVVQHAILNSFGYVTRSLGAGPGLNEPAKWGHHGINEVWVNALCKWVLMDAKYDLHFDTGRDGKKEIVEGTGSNTVVRQGNLLAMTAPEACACGLAAGTVEDFATLGKLLRVGKWTALECHAPTLMEHRQKAAAQAQKDFDRLDGEFEQNMKDARQSDPSRFKYQAYRDGSLTPESQKQWQERSVPCLKALTAAGQDLDKMAALAQKFPQFLTGADDIRKNKDAVESMKSALRK